MAREKLTLMRKGFADGYPIDLNATQAAIRAGYSPIRGPLGRGLLTVLNLGPIIGPEKMLLVLGRC